MPIIDATYFDVVFMNICNELVLRENYLRQTRLFRVIRILHLNNDVLEIAITCYNDILSYYIYNLYHRVVLMLNIYYFNQYMYIYNNETM